jgi:hypothetical protein
MADLYKLGGNRFVSELSLLEINDISDISPTGLNKAMDMQVEAERRKSAQVLKSRGDI